MVAYPPHDPPCWVAWTRQPRLLQTAFSTTYRPCSTNGFPRIAHCRTKRFKKGGDVDFAQMLGRGGSRALDVELSCDTHDSLGLQLYHLMHSKCC